MAHASRRPLTARSEAHIVAAASYQLPLLWLTLFGADDLTTVTMPLEDAAGHESEGPVPTLHAPFDGACSRYAERRERVHEMLPATLHTHILEWDALQEAISQPNVQLDIAELWMMQSETEFEQDIRTFLGGLDIGGAPWREVCEQAGLDVDPDTGEVDFDPDLVRFGLRGYQWEAPVPWTD